MVRTRIINKLLIIGLVSAGIAAVAAGAFKLRVFFDKRADLSVSETAGWDQIAALLSDGKRDEAVAAIRRIDAGGEGAGATFEEIMVRGVAAHQSGRFGQAAGYFLDAIQMQRNDPAGYLNLAESLRVGGHPALAIPVLRDAVALSPGNFLFNVKLRLLMIETGNAEAVGREVSAARARGADTPDLALVEAALLLRSGNTADAVSKAAAARQKMPPPLFNACMSDPVLAALGAPGNAPLAPGEGR